MYKSRSTLYAFAMARGFRTALVWLITLTLCMSAQAGTALSRCGGMPVVAMPSSHQTVADTQHTAANCETMASGAHSAKSSHADCTASASCSMCAAPAPQTPVLFAAATRAAPPPPPRTPGFGFFTDAPDRPPRALA
jgi:hypothetical protein